ncbi:glycosyl transferase family 2 [Roseimicrobium gellanilyticum]|uniref:Glycosyl transferase family 2 n=1 Tax=Roseimicrobium gellanilyticum TaxID=748857 RepID=A0A366HVJ4_9BACT|nr:glycosyltransferase family A protein [Roseimicrobium gellanilyticum]RBP48117.1 glycosyl transferase family 2 [Roseimicrobium gellanilyticum]
MSRPKVEVRIITYKRPALLRRALAGLYSQTYTDWRAVVYDDSPDQESLAIVNELGDARIECRPNAKNLGAALNLCKAFAPEPVFDDTEFACVLEDDNLFQPTLLEENVKSLQANKEPVLARNFLMVDIEEDGSFTSNPDEPMRSLYGSESRVITYRDRVLEAFFTYTIGNLSYFWRLHRGVNLSALEPYNASLSEPRRAVSFQDDCRYEPEPLAVFGRFVCKKQSPRSGSAGGVLRHRLAHLSEVYFTRDQVRRWTRDVRESMDAVLKQARERSEGATAIFHLAEAGVPAAILALRSGRQWLNLLKTIPLRITYSPQYKQGFHALVQETERSSASASQKPDLARSK